MFRNCLDLRSYRKENCSHTHDFAQLVLPIRGSMELEVGGFSGVVNDTIGVYIAPGERHCFAGSQKNLFLVMDLKSQNSLSNQTSESNIFNLTTSTKKFLQFAHYYLTQQQRDFFTDSYIHQLLFHFTANSFSPEPDLTVIKAKEWINHNFEAPVDLQNIAKHCCLSISQLQRRFKRALGCSLAEYWRMKKLEYAKSLLTQKNSPIEAIALDVGYENLSAFSRRFSKAFGESPSQWRAKALAAKKLREMDKRF